MEIYKNITIVILDDNHLICDTMEKFISQSGPWRKVISFNSPQKALTYCHDLCLKDTIFIVDLNLGKEMSGFDFLKELVNLYPFAPENTIICTGDHDASLLEDYRHFSVSAFFQKPYNLIDLAVALREISERISISKFNGKLHKKLIDSNISCGFPENRALIENKKEVLTARQDPKILFPGQKKLNELQEKTNSLFRLVEQLYSELENQEALEKLSQIKDGIDYCDILRGIFTNLFFDPQLHLTEFDPNKTISYVFRALSSDARYNFEQYTAAEGLIRSDEALLRQVIFILLKHIEHYLYGEKGWVKIEVGFSENLLECGSRENCDLRLHYGLTDVRVPSKNKNRILIVDDEPLFCKVLKRSFFKEGFDAHSVLSGFDCMDFLSENIVDLIILDIFMDEMNGDEVLESIRRNINLKNVPVLILSGRMTEEDIPYVIEKYSKYGPVDALVKTPSVSEQNESPFNKIINISKELLKLDPVNYGVKDLFNDTLEDSIQTDPILAMGSYSNHLLSKLLDLKISFLETDGLNAIQVHIPSTPSKVCQHERPLHRAESLTSISNDLVTSMFRGFRHDLRNRILLISVDAESIKSMVSASFQNEILDRIIAGVDAYVTILESL